MLLPDVPVDLAARALPIVSVGPVVCYRLYDLCFSPIHFSTKPCQRCTVVGDSVLYLSDQPHGAYLEAVPLKPSAGLPAVGPTLAWLRGHAVVEVHLMRPLRFVDLTGAGLAKLGLTNLFSCCDHRDAQRWCQALWEHPDAVDSILFRSRVDPSCVNLAVFGRAADAVVVGAPAVPTRWDPILSRYRHVIFSDY